MRAMEIFEAEPDYRFLFHRLNMRVTEIWSQAADDPQTAIHAAQRLYLMLQSKHLNGQDEVNRQTLLKDIRRFLDFMRS